MTRIRLVPTRAAGGRSVVLQAVPLTPRERLRALVSRLIGRRA